ncbi:MAG: tetratricopeptide repeat protein [Betaproteobacteria bacterium]
MTIRQNPDADQALDEIARLMRAGEHSQARKLCERVLAQSPEDADVLIWLAQIAMDDALWAEAIAAFDRALQIRLDPWSLGNLAMCYCRTGRLKEAEHCLRGALGLKPDLVRAHVNLAAVLHGLRRFDDALAQLATASALDANDYQIAMRQGNALTELGRFDDAQTAYAHAARLAGKFVYPRLVAFDRATLDEITSHPRVIAPPRMLDEINPPADYRYVVLISCDPAYLRKHGFAFIRSFAEHAQGGNLLHVHVYDADDPLIDETREVARQADLACMAMSTETCPFPRSEPQQRKSYYACGRLLHLPYWLNCYQRPLLSLDVDVIVKGRLDLLVDAAAGGDLALNRREPIDSPWLDVIANIIVANPTAAARRYLEAVGNYVLRYIEREREAWLVDQTALFCVLKMMARFGEPPAVAWIAESQHPCLWHYGGANEHSVGDPRYLKYAAQ